MHSHYMVFLRVNKQENPSDPDRCDELALEFSFDCLFVGNSGKRLNLQHGCVVTHASTHKRSLATPIKFRK